MMRVGVVSYVNALPLAHGLEARLTGAQVVRAMPSRIALDLAQGDLDVGLVPVAALQPSWPRVPGLGIASRGPVRSVLLVSRVPVPAIERLVLDPASRTSNVLAQLWLGRRVGGRPLRTVSGDADVTRRLGQGDATVVIGEDALFLDPARHDEIREVTDLGQAWSAWTDLPMTYAVWAGPGAGDPDLAASLLACYRENAERLGALAALAAGGNTRRRADLESYLRWNIVYRRGEAEEAGLRRFLAMAGESGLLTPGPGGMHAALS